jgi:hypothetical protein
MTDTPSYPNKKKNKTSKVRARIIPINNQNNLWRLKWQVTGIYLAKNQSGLVGYYFVDAHYVL